MEKFAYFQVEVNDIVLMYVSHCLADLSHEYRAGFFRQNKLLVEHSIEQLAAVNPAKCDS